MGVDVSLSGSTFIQLVVETYSGRITCGNVGDSRAIIASLRNKSWIVNELSHDHKPDLPAEAMRIHQSGGRVEAYQDS
jgi:serine/threonine protein phosphatase PrpC